MTSFNKSDISTNPFPISPQPSASPSRVPVQSVFPSTPSDHLNSDNSQFPRNIASVPSSSSAVDSHQPVLDPVSRRLLQDTLNQHSPLRSYRATNYKSGPCQQLLASHIFTVEPSSVTSGPTSHFQQSGGDVEAGEIPGSSGTSSLSQVAESMCANMPERVQYDDGHAAHAFHHLIEMFHSQELCDVILHIYAGNHCPSSSATPTALSPAHGREDATGAQPYVIPCHRVVLACFSAYFAAMFKSNMIESQSLIVPMYNMEYTAMVALVRFCYTGELVLSPSNIICIMHTACVLQMERAIPLCEQYVLSNLRVEHVLDIRKFAHLYHLQNLLKEVDRFIAINFLLLMEQHQGVKEMTYPMLCVILRHPQLTVRSEEEVATCVLQWVAHDIPRRRAHFPSLVLLMRLLQLPYDFLDCCIYTADVHADRAAEIYCRSVLRLKIMARSEEPRLVEHMSRALLLALGPLERHLRFNTTITSRKEEFSGGERVESPTHSEMMEGLEDAGGTADGGRRVKSSESQAEDTEVDANPSVPGEGSDGVKRMTHNLDLILQPGDNLHPSGDNRIQTEEDAGAPYAVAMEASGEERPVVTTESATESGNEFRAPNSAVRFTREDMLEYMSGANMQPMSLFRTATMALGTQSGPMGSSSVNNSSPLDYSPSIVLRSSRGTTAASSSSLEVNLHQHSTGLFPPPPHSNFPSSTAAAASLLLGSYPLEYWRAGSRPAQVTIAQERDEASATAAPFMISNAFLDASQLGMNPMAPGSSRQSVSHSFDNNAPSLSGGSAFPLYEDIYDAMRLSASSQDGSSGEFDSQYLEDFVDLMRPRPSYAGVVLCVGGRGCPNTPYAEAEVYDPLTDTWSSMVKMLTPRRHVGLIAHGMEVVAIGGHDGRRHLASGEKFSTVDCKWTQMQPMHTARRGLALAWLSSCLFCLGGLDDSTCFKTVERFSFATNQWSNVSSMRSPRGGLAVTTLCDKIIAIGGNDSHTSVNSCEMFDPIAQTWMPMPHMSDKRAGASAAQVDGVVYVVGGFDDNMPLSSIERYDQREGRWRHMAPMQHARGGVGAASLGGKVYAIGGHNGESYLSSTEVFDPCMNRWRESASLKTQRAGGGVCSFDIPLREFLSSLT